MPFRPRRFGDRLKVGGAGQHGLARGSTVRVSASFGAPFVAVAPTEVVGRSLSPFRELRPHDAVGRRLICPS